MEGVHASKLYHCNKDCKNGRQDYWKTTNPDKKCHTKLELLDYLYEYYFGSKNWTLSRMYEQWILLTEEDMKKGLLSINTFRKYKSDYEKYIAEHPIAQRKMEDIRTSELFRFYREIVGDEKITRKALNNVKTLINCIFDYATSEHDLNVITSRSIDTKKLKCKEIEHSKYSEEERQKLFSEALKPQFWKNVHIRAYLLDTQLDTRIGEIEALSWDDIDFDKKTIYIHREVIKKYNADTGKPEFVRVPHTKNRKSEGNRTLPLTDFAIKILKYQRSVNPFGDYVFMCNDHALRTDVINKALKSVCKSAGIRYLSTHKTRFWAISALLSSGIDKSKVQAVSGHTTAEMTEYYCLLDKESEKKLAVDHDTWNRIFNIKEA